MVLQRPHEVDLVERWTGRRLGHATCPPSTSSTTPPRSTRCAASTRCVRDPWLHACRSCTSRLQRDGLGLRRHPTDGHRARRARPRLPLHRRGRRRSPSVVNEPVRRWRVAGSDLLLDMARRVPVDVYGMGSGELGERAVAEGVPSARRAGCTRTCRRPRCTTRIGRATGPTSTPTAGPAWASPCIEAMTLGLPVLALSTTEAPEAVPADAGLVTYDRPGAGHAPPAWLADPDDARHAGLAARAHALTASGSPGSSTTGTASWKEVSP